MHINWDYFLNLYENQNNTKQRWPLIVDSNNTASMNTHTTSNNKFKI